MNIKQGFASTVEWIKEDYQSNQIRFFLEAIAWIISIGCTIAVAVYAPYPPMFVLYPFFILQCAIFAWAAWTRRSSGMLANYLLLVGIDSIALSRMLFQ